MTENKKEHKGFLLFPDQYEPIKGMSLEQKGRLLDAMFEYNLGQEPEISDPMVRMAFGFFRAAFDRDSVRRSNISEKRQAAAKSRWSANDASASDAMQTMQMDANAPKEKKIKEKKQEYNNTPHTPPLEGGRDALSRSRSSQVTKTESQEAISGYTENQELREALTAFVESRRAIRKPLSAHGLHLALLELDKLAASDDALKVAIVNQSVLNGWQGLFPLKDNARASPESAPVRKSWAEMEEERTRAEFLRITSSPEWKARHAGGQS